MLKKFSLNADGTMRIAKVSYVVIWFQARTWFAEKRKFVRTKNNNNGALVQQQVAEADIKIYIRAFLGDQALHVLFESNTKFIQLNWLRLSMLIPHLVEVIRASNFLWRVYRSIRHALIENNYN